MGRALLAAFLHDLSGTLSQLISETRTSSTKSVLQKLMATLLMLDLLVDDAEEKQFQDVAKAREVNMWVNELRHALYRLEEHMREWQSLQGKVKTRRQGRQLLLKVLSAASKKKAEAEAVGLMKAQICDTIDGLEVLLKKKDVFGLTERASTALRWERESKQLQYLPSSSAVLDNYFCGSNPKDYFYGRHEEEKCMLEILLSTAETEQHIKVINIVAEVGAGKTAFADIIYFSHKVRESFQLRAWVNVPYKVSIAFLARKILEAVTEEFIADDDFDALRKRLQESFASKRFLLVLDDIRFEEGDGLDKWNMLIASFEAAGARGSAIILTSTPYDDPLFLPPATHTVHLALLSTDNYWSIFSVHAFGQMDLHDHPELEAVGKQIANKFGNLPMAAKMIGSLLQDKLHLILNDWFEISTIRIPDAGQVNFPFPSFLVLCYLDLPAHLKRCFAYLSIFPKAYQFKKKEVVLLWMAQGFLLSSDSKSIDKTKSMEDIGDEYFGYLVMRSFLQPFGSGVGFIMHNEVHDLASYVFGESYNYHMSYSGSTQDLGELLWDRNPLLVRTILPVFLPLEWPPRQFHRVEEIIGGLNPLVFRVLSLSHYDITYLPASIGRLSHLCYIDLSHTAIQMLPDSICDLLNLQTLLLTNCSSLTSFPQRMCNLINLRYLDVRDSGVQEMPLKMHKLASLRTLTDFIVSKNRPSFGDLAGLSNLKTLTISKLQNVAYAKAASDAKMKEKTSLDDLMLQWGNDNDSNGNEMEVLENLETHQDLKRLTIEYYGGARFPNWLGDPSYWALQLVDIRHCRNCNSLPTLGLLPLLKDLFIEGFTKVSSIGHEFYGVMTASHKPFQSLQSLQFQDMLEWKEWNIPEGVDFPCLNELYIIRCPKLVGYLPKQLLSLEKLEIFGCYDLVAPLPKVSNTCEVFVHDSNEILMRNVVKSSTHASLRRVTISEEVQEITPQSYSGFPSTRYTVGSSLSEIEEIGETRIETESKGNRLPPNPASLDTTRIPKLKELSSSLVSHQVECDIPNIELQTDLQSSLAKADIPTATQVTVFPLTDTPKTTTRVKVETLSTEDLDDQRSSFETLKVSTVSQLKLLSPKLVSLKIEACESLEALPDDLQGRIATLQELYLIGCSSLRSFPYLASLTTLYIRNCRSLEFLPSLESKHKHPSLQHLFIGSSCDSLTTLPLDLFSELKILCLWDCLNLLSFYFTGEFRGALASLESLEIRDCPRLRFFLDEGLLTPNLASIYLSNCKDLNKLPNSMNTLTSLKSLFLHRCPQIESFPFGGLPSSLILLSIAYCDKLTPQEEWGLHKLESLSHFELEGGCIGMESFPEEKLLPSNINSLRISTLQSLKKLDYKGFQHLNALHTLEIHRCNILRSLPEQGLPSSLNYLCVQECSLLTPRLKPKTGKDWHKVADIPHLEINDQVLS